MNNDEFEQKIGRLTKSTAYLAFCEEVYGYRNYFFNMMDKAQIEFLLNEIPVSKKDMVMDLGCGSGSILSLFIDKHGCHGVGVDLLDKSLFECRDKRVTYICSDIDDIKKLNTAPSILLSVDSFYFSKNLDALISQINGMNCKRMYCFFSQYIFDESTEEKRILQSDKTKLAEALNKNGIPFTTIDYSENEFQLYQNSLQALPEYKKEFDAEGNMDLYEQKYRENLLGYELYQKGLARRYLYIVEPCGNEGIV